MYYVLDTETASLSSGVVELAFLRVDSQLNVVEEFVSRCNPQRKIEAAAFAIHNISQKDVADAPTLAELALNLPEQIDLIAHNAPFDARMIKPSIAVGRSLCTLALSRAHIKGTSNHKLSTLRTELKLPVQTDHTALGDVYTTLALLKYIVALTGIAVETQFQRHLQPKMLSRMPFGKHKGLAMLDVPADYRKWMLQQDIECDLKYTLEKLESL